MIRINDYLNFCVMVSVLFLFSGCKSREARHKAGSVGSEPPEMIYQKRADTENTSINLVDQMIREIQKICSDYLSEDELIGDKGDDFSKLMEGCRSLSEDALKQWINSPSFTEYFEEFQSLRSHQGSDTGASLFLAGNEDADQSRSGSVSGAAVSLMILFSAMNFYFAQEEFTRFRDMLNPKYIGNQQGIYRKGPRAALIGTALIGMGISAAAIAYAGYGYLSKQEKGDFLDTQRTLDVALGATIFTGGALMKFHDYGLADEMKKFKGVGPWIYMGVGTALVLMNSGALNLAGSPKDQTLQKIAEKIDVIASFQSSNNIP